MHIHHFHQLLVKAFSHYCQNTLLDYHFDHYQKQLLPKNFFAKIWAQIFSSTSQASSTHYFIHLIHEVTTVYLGEALSKRTLHNRLMEERVAKLSVGFSYKSLQEFRDIHHYFAELLEKENEKEEFDQESLRAYQLITERFNELIRTFESALEPDLSMMSFEFIREYEELSSQLLYLGSPWMSIPNTALHQLVRRLKKEGDRIEFYQGLKASHYQLIVQCKQAKIVSQQLLSSIKELQATNSDDLRFDIKELEEIRYLAKNLTYETSGKTTYATLFNHYTQTILHEKYKKQLGRSVVGDMLTFEQLRLALHIGKQHLEVVDKLCCNDDELAAKQQLIQYIIYGPNAAPIASSSSIFPFTCEEFRQLINRSSAQKNFLQFHLENACPVQEMMDTISDETVHSIEREFAAFLQASHYQKIQQLFDTLDISTRDIRRKEFIRSFSPELRLAVHGHLSNEKLEKRFQEDFPKLVLQTKIRDAKEVFNCPELEESLFNSDGNACARMIRERYGAMVEAQWKEIYPLAFEKKKRQSIPSELLSEIHQEEMALFWTKITSQIKYNDKKTGQNSDSKMIKYKRSYLRNGLSLYLESYNEAHFGLQLNGEWSAITKEGLGRIGVQMTDKPVYYVDGEVQSFGYTRRVTFYQKGDNTRIPRTDLGGNLYRIGKTVQSLHINMERDTGTYVLYHGLHVNDRSADLIDELYTLLRNRQKETERQELSNLARSSSFDKS